MWASKFIKEYALSTCESEIRAIASGQPAIKSALYLQKILRESVEAGLLVEDCEQPEMKLSMPLVILEDNKAAIDWSNRPTSTQRMRHVEKSLYWIRQFVASKAIVLKHVSTDDQLADIGTKPLSVPAFQSLAQRLMTYYI
jgi:histone deacetylase 1/2